MSALTGGASRRYIVLGAIVVVTLWLWLAVDKQYSPAHIIWTVYNDGQQTLGVVQKTDVFDFPPVKSQAIRDVCASTKWNSSLVFTCDNNHGGIGHVRNSILNCVRYAMAAGGSLVLPSIALREDDEMGETHANGEKEEEMGEMSSHFERRHGYGRQGIEYMFDKTHFVESMRLSCPEMPLIRHMEETITDRRRALLPESIFPNVPTSGIEHPEEWPKRLEAWIEGSMSHTPAEEPIIIDLEQSFLHYPTHSDGHEFAHSFGNILKFRPDVRKIATKVLRQMADWYDMNLNLSQPILVPSFFGAHLNTESPFLEARHNTDVLYSHYEAQASAYLELASHLHLKVMYVASGNVADVHKLSVQATEYDISVTHKEDLLKGADLEQLDALRWDQRALVDYLVVLKAQEFGGVGHSPFSWQIAMTRHEAGNKEKGTLEREVYADGLSTLYGVRYDYVESSFCMWS
jgi:hypothetical protein